MSTPALREPRVAVLGCGYWGRNLVRNFHELGALAAIADPAPERASEMERLYGVPSRKVGAILNDPDIDAVVLAVPAEHHARAALDALAAGKHVFVEKPLALTLADGEQVLRAAERAGRLVMVGHLLQYHPAFLRLHQLCSSGELGRLHYIYSNRLNLGKIRREENVFWSFAPHDISMILRLVGEEPERVEASGYCYLHKHVTDVTTTRLAFPSGVNAHIFVSWLHPCKEQRLVVVGDAGMAVFDDGQPWPRKLLLYRHKILWREGQPEPSRAEPEPVAVEESEPLRLECRHFLDCVRDGRKPRTDVAEGLAVLRVLAAAERALAADASSLASSKPAIPLPRQAEWTAHPTAVIDEGVEIGAGTRIWHFSHLLKGTRIGRDCTVGQNVSIGPDVVIGDRCKIQNNVSVYNGVTLEDDVFLGPSCVLTNVSTPRAAIDRRNDFQRTRIGRGATVGANATIVCGHDLAPYCFVAAGAVVTRDVPAFALVAGNPARRIGWVGHAGERLGPDFVCPRTGRRYRQVDESTLVEVPTP
jgi:predicted dehydrogenase/acetyltransferase-like isoleucine patch superfamily enzyme